MSHITKLKVEIKDLATLEQACQILGLKFNLNQQSYKWYSGVGGCTHAISVPNNLNAYEIGIVDNRDGTFELRGDFDAGDYELRNLAGSRGSKLIETYTKTVAVNEAKKLAAAEGYTVHVEEDTQTGETVIILRGY